MRSKQSAFSPVIILVIVGLVLAGVGYYFFSQKSAGSSSSILNNPDVKKELEKELADIKDPLIKKHFGAQFSQTSFRTKSLSSGRGEVTTVMEVQSKGEEVNFRTQEVDQNNKETSHMITMGDSTYVKDYKDNKWWKQTIKPDESKFTENLPKPEDFKDEFAKKKNTTEYKKLGEETCGPSTPGLTCYKYEEINSENKEGSRVFWFDNKQFLLRKDEMKFGEFTTKNEYSYDNISISAPFPTKEVPEGKNIYEYLVSPASGSSGSSGIPNLQDLEQFKKEAESLQQQIPDVPDIPDSGDYSGE